MGLCLAHGWHVPQTSALCLANPAEARRIARLARFAGPTDPAPRSKLRPREQSRAEVLGKPASSLTDLEHVAGSAHGVDVPRLLRITFYFLPQTTNIHVHDAWRNESSVVPDCVQQTFAGEHPAGVGGQKLDETEFRRRGYDRIIARRQAHGGGINHQIAGPHDFFFQRLIKTPQDGSYPGNDFFRAEGLSDVVVRPNPVPPQAVGLGGASGHTNDGHSRQGGVIANGPGNVDSAV